MVSVLCNCLAWGIYSICDVQVLPISIPPATSSSSRFAIAFSKWSGLHLGFCSRGGGKIAVSAYQGGQALHAVHYNIYIVKFQGGGECPPPLKTILGIDCEKYLRNSGCLKCWLGLFSVQLCNYAVKSGY